MTTQLFCLHGFLGAASDWETALPWPEVRSADWLRDRELNASTDWCSLGSAIQRWADAHTASSRILVGYSMGGRLALQTLLQSPESWDAAVIISAHPGLTSSEERTARVEHDRKWAKRFLNENWETVMNAWNAQPVFQGEENPIARQGSPELRAALAHALETWSVGTQPDFRAALSTLNRPILWIAGEKDGKYAEIARQCANLNPLFESAIIAGAGHRAPWTANEEFQLILKNWIQNKRRPYGNATRTLDQDQGLQRHQA